MGTTEKVRRQGRAEAVVFVFVQLSRAMPGIDLSEIARMVGVTLLEVKEARDRLMKQARHGHRPSFEPPRRAMPRDDSVSCTRCGKSIPRTHKPGAPQRVCDDCRGVRAPRRESAYA